MSLSSQRLAQQIRAESLRMVARANASHIGGALSMTDIIAVLYADILRLQAENPAWPERDRFILSKGHACTALYAALAWKGFFPVEELTTFAQDGSRLMSHISHGVPGVEFSTGSLGHGLPFGCGKALAAKRQSLPWRTFVLLSDGDLNEGSNWETIMFTPHHRLDNLVALVDYNRLQGLGEVGDVLELEPLAEKFRAFRWAVREVNGHDHEALRAALSSIPWEAGKPNVLLARTVKGKGVDFMENQTLWHYKSPSAEQLQSALRQIESAT